MGALIVLREGCDADFILSILADRVHHSDFLFVALESGAKAKRKKFGRYIARDGFLRKVQALVFDLPALVVFSKIQQKLMFRGQKLIAAKSQAFFRFDDVNDRDFHEYVAATNPTHILNYGTALYSRVSLAAINRPIVNFHSGVLPKYRNVHTDFWAYLNKDFDGIGVTTFLLNDGIDTGRVLSISKPEIVNTDYLWGIKLKNLRIVTTEIEKYLENQSLDNFIETTPPVASLSGKGALWHTPKLVDLLRYSRLEISKFVTLSRNSLNL